MHSGLWPICPFLAFGSSILMDFLSASIQIPNWQANFMAKLSTIAIQNWLGSRLSPFVGEIVQIHPISSVRFLKRHFGRFMARVDRCAKCIVGYGYFGRKMKQEEKPGVFKEKPFFFQILWNFCNNLRDKIKLSFWYHSTGPCAYCIETWLFWLEDEAREEAKCF